MIKRETPIGDRIQRAKTGMLPELPKIQGESLFQELLRKSREKKKNQILKKLQNNPTGLDAAMERKLGKI